MPTSSQFAHCRGASQEHENSGGEGKREEGGVEGNNQENEENTGGSGRRGVRGGVKKKISTNSKRVEKKIEGGGAKYFTKQFKVVTKINVFIKKRTRPTQRNKCTENW